MRRIPVRFRSWGIAAAGGGGLLLVLSAALLDSDPVPCAPTGLSERAKQEADAEAQRIVPLLLDRVANAAAHARSLPSDPETSEIEAFAAELKALRDWIVSELDRFADPEFRAYVEARIRERASRAVLPGTLGFAPAPSPRGVFAAPRLIAPQAEQQLEDLVAKFVGKFMEAQNPAQKAAFAQVLENLREIGKLFDTTAPEVTVTLSPSKALYNAADLQPGVGVTVMMKDALSGLDEASFTFPLSGALSFDPILGTGELTATLVAESVPDGDVVLAAGICDRAGNCGEGSAEFVKDTTSPQIEFVFPQQDSFLLDLSFGLHLDVQDAVSGVASVTVLLNAQDVTAQLTPGSPITGTLTGVEGLNALTVMATDGAGNVGDGGITFTIHLGPLDMTWPPPVDEVTVELLGGDRGTPETVLVELTDSIVEHVAVRFRRSDGSPAERIVVRPTLIEGAGAPYYPDPRHLSDSQGIARFDLLTASAAGTAIYRIEAMNAIVTNELLVTVQTFPQVLQLFDIAGEPPGSAVRVEGFGPRRTAVIFEEVDDEDKPVAPADSHGSFLYANRLTLLNGQVETAFIIGAGAESGTEIRLRATTPEIHDQAGKPLSSTTTFVVGEPVAGANRVTIQSGQAQLVFPGEWTDELKVHVVPDSNPDTITVAHFFLLPSNYAISLDPGEKEGDTFVEEPALAAVIGDPFAAQPDALSVQCVGDVCSISVRMPDWAGPFYVGVVGANVLPEQPASAGEIQDLFALGPPKVEFVDEAETPLPFLSAGDIFGEEGVIQKASNELSFRIKFTATQDGEGAKRLFKLVARGVTPSRDMVRLDTSVEPNIERDDYADRLAAEEIELEAERQADARVYLTERIAVATHQNRITGAFKILNTPLGGQPLIAGIPGSRLGTRQNYPIRSDSPNIRQPTWVFVGDSLTNGTQAVAVVDGQQRNSYPAVLGMLANVPVRLPLMEEPGVPPRFYGNPKNPNAPLPEPDTDVLSTPLGDVPFLKTGGSTPTLWLELATFRMFSRGRMPEGFGFAHVFAIDGAEARNAILNGRAKLYGIEGVDQKVGDGTRRAFENDFKLLTRAGMEPESYGEPNESEFRLVMETLYTARSVNQEVDNAQVDVAKAYEPDLAVVWLGNNDGLQAAVMNGVADVWALTPIRQGTGDVNRTQLRDQHRDELLALQPILEAGLSKDLPTLFPDAVFVASFNALFDEKLLGFEETFDEAISKIKSGPGEGPDTVVGTLPPVAALPVLIRMGGSLESGLKSIDGRKDSLPFKVNLFGRDLTDENAQFNLFEAQLSKTVLGTDDQPDPDAPEATNADQVSLKAVLERVGTNAESIVSPLDVLIQSPTALLPFSVGDWSTRRSGARGKFADPANWTPAVQQQILGELRFREDQILRDEERTRIRTRIEDYNKRINELAAAKGYHIFDIGPIFADADSPAGYVPRDETGAIIFNHPIFALYNGEAFSLDGVHPGAYGHAAIAHELAKRLRALAAARADQKIGGVPRDQIRLMAEADFETALEKDDVHNSGLGK